MIRIVFAVFFVLHGLVHLLYLGQSARLFELQPGMVWPEGSWALSGVIGNAATRILANVVLGLACVGFAAGGFGLIFKQGWWEALIIGSAVVSSLLYFFLWDGDFHNLDDKGGVGIGINLVILIALIVFHWPDLTF